MGYLFGGLVVGVVALLAFLYAQAQKGKDSESATAIQYACYLVAAFASVGAVLLFFASSFTHVGGDEVGHLTRVYFGQSMPPGQVVALPGQNGPQARTLSPGFHFVPLLKVMNKVENFKVIEIADDQYGYVVAVDGKPLRPGQFLADSWTVEQFEQMMDAEYFLEHNGQKGPQLTVWPPGTYRYNHHLFNVTAEKATNIEAGIVGVVKSNVQEKPEYDCQPILHDSKSGALSNPLVSKGCVGIWNVPLQPARYYLNRHAYEVTKISTRAEAWEYKGGYTRHFIDLRVDQEGKITQVERAENVPVPSDAADPAIAVRVQGWIVPLELRVIAQVSAEDAPFVVASVGGLRDVEDKILTPTIRSVLRNIAGEPERKVLDLQDQRALIEKKVEETIRPEGVKAGVSIKEVRFGDPIIPPELLVAVLRNQLAVQLTKTYEQEKNAQDQRIQTEQARATADQQDRLVGAQIDVQVAEQQVKVAEQQKQAAKLRGEGQEAELTAIARGQKAQATVLGEKAVLQLAALQKVLDAAGANPNIVKVPQVNVESGGGADLPAFAAILGSVSNIAKGSESFNPSEPKK
ncbi:MAG: hypothetical protein HYS15_01535 [Candidatus Spechtbacteria bacterium]|nr:hypothetical protein [Candidatus Spechtbacteria bacterium]